MSAFVKTLSDLVALFLQTLRLSVVLPACLWVGLNLAFILPLFKGTKPYEALAEFSGELPVLVTISAVILLVSYSLSVLNVPIIRFFEGYYLLGMPGAERRRKGYLRRLFQIQDQVEALDRAADQAQRMADEVGDRKESEQYAAKANQYELYRNILNDELSMCYPHHQPWRVLPTRLGNVIAAAEEYSGHLFGVDSVTFWPFLTPILSEKGYATFIEREKAALDFLLNTAVLLGVFGTELAITFALRPQPSWGLGVIQAAAAIVLTIGLAYGFYRMSIQGALSWGYTIRVAFVLHRDELRKRLGLIQPEGFYEERVLWSRATRFYADHDVTPGRTILEYPPR